MWPGCTVPARTTCIATIITCRKQTWLVTQQALNLLKERGYLNKTLLVWILGEIKRREVELGPRSRTDCLEAENPSCWVVPQQLLFGHCLWDSPPPPPPPPTHTPTETAISTQMALCWQRPHLLNPLTAMMWFKNQPIKVRNLKLLSLFFFFFALDCERIFVKTRSTESRCVTGPGNGLFAGAWVHHSARTFYRLGQRRG